MNSAFAQDKLTHLHGTSDWFTKNFIQTARSLAAKWEYLRRVTRLLRHSPPLAASAINTALLLDSFRKRRTATRQQALSSVTVGEEVSKISVRNGPRSTLVRPEGFRAWGKPLPVRRTVQEKVGRGLAHQSKGKLLPRLVLLGRARRVRRHRQEGSGQVERHRFQSERLLGRQLSVQRYFETLQTTSISQSEGGGPSCHRHIRHIGS